MSCSQSSRFSTTSMTGRRSALGLEQALERHEQPRLEPLRRVEQRVDDRAVVERHAEQVRDEVRDLGHPLRLDDLGDAGLDLVAALRRILALQEAEVRGQRARDRPVGVRVLVGDPRQHEHGRIRRAGPRDQLAEDPALAHAGLADHHGERQLRAAHRTRDRVSAWRRRMAGRAAGELRSQIVASRS